MIPITEAQRQAMHEAAATVNAEHRLMTVTVPSIAERVQSEVERRCAVFALSRLAPMSARRAAVMSVYRDVCEGLIS